MTTTGAAPRARRVWSHARIEASIVVRNGEQLLLALAVPLALIVGHAVVGERVGIPREPFIASVIALGLWSTGFTSLAILTGYERRYGVLERLVATPLRRLDLLLGKAIAMGLTALAQAAVLAGVGLAVGWRPAPAPAQTLVLLLVVPLSLLTFSGLALALAGTATAELTLGLSNLVYLLGAAGGVLVPLAGYPPWAASLLAWLPTGALGETLRTWSTGGVDPFPVAVAALWAVLSLTLARKVFRWTS
jgi:ABC-2 type transport system permease protein